MKRIKVTLTSCCYERRVTFMIDPKTEENATLIRTRQMPYGDIFDNLMTPSQQKRFSDGLDGEYLYKEDYEVNE